MKRIVRSDLEGEGYLIVEEPLWPPIRRISWSAYRPDMLGIRRDMRTEEIVVVECETHPSMKRFRSKNFASLSFQASVLYEGSIRRILAVPRHRLGSVDLLLRDKWEVWLLGEARPEMKLGTFCPPGAPSEAVREQGGVAPRAPPPTGSCLPPIRAGRTRR